MFINFSLIAFAMICSFAFLVVYAVDTEAPFKLLPLPDGYTIKPNKSIEEIDSSNSNLRRTNAIFNQDVAKGTDVVLGLVLAYPSMDTVFVIPGLINGDFGVKTAVVSTHSVSWKSVYFNLYNIHVGKHTIIITYIGTNPAIPDGSQSADFIGFVLSIKTPGVYFSAPANINAGETTASSQTIEVTSTFTEIAINFKIDPNSAGDTIYPNDVYVINYYA